MKIIGAYVGVKLFRFILDNANRVAEECCRKVVVAIRSIVNTRILLLDCSRILHEGPLMPVYMYKSERMI